jgi:hypothetical protein
VATKTIKAAKSLKIAKNKCTIICFGNKHVFRAVLKTFSAAVVANRNATPLASTQQSPCPLE